VTCTESFLKGERARLPGAAHDEDVSGPQQVGDVGPVAEEGDREAMPVDGRLERGTQRTVAGDGDRGNVGGTVTVRDIVNALRSVS